MNEHLLFSRQHPANASIGIISRVCRSCLQLIPARIGRQLHRLGHRLTLLVVALVSVLTFCTAFLVINIMDDILLHSMIQRGAASAYAIAASAGYSILAGDQPALDNLVAPREQDRNNPIYVAILDNSRKALAHTRPERTGSIIPRLEGRPIETDGQLRVNRVLRADHPAYEFNLPIHIDGQPVGEVLVAFDPQSLLDARTAAHWRILFIAFLAILFGAAGALYLAGRFTHPITQLSKGVARLRASSGKVSVPILSDDEMGELTRNFNEMATELAAHKQSLRDYSTDLEKSYHDVIRILSGALDARDNYTYGHSTRVSALAVMLGTQLDLDPQQLKHLEIACLLHDIGKIRVPDDILNKQAPLDPRESLRIREHPDHGVKILELAESLHRYIPAVKHHHEWFNGQGYPAGLRGNQIPLEAQIVAIADAYDAMTTSRPYRSGLSTDAAIAEIRRNRGTQFAPRLSDIFISALQQPGQEVTAPLSTSRELPSNEKGRA